VELLIDTAAILSRTRPSARVLVVGGEPQQVDRARGVARERGAADSMIFTGQQPAREIPSFVQACDVLVSPRIRGTNTPLKIYSYLRSGRPILATNLLTHTQVLSPDIAVLVPPEPEPFAEALAALLDDAEGARGAGGARAGRRRREVQPRGLCPRTAQAYARLSPGGASAAVSSSVNVAER
jgi:glycosyltransferase involved in cell wall biosynthesis